LGASRPTQLAAHHPELVRALIIEDVGAVMRRPEISHPVLNVYGWVRFAPSREARVPDANCFLHSAVAGEQGWRLLFDFDEMVAVQQHGLGDWWNDWPASTCPALR
jgi:esterase